MITLEQLYDLYDETLQNCGIHLLNETNEYIEMKIFEDFDIGIISFFHEESLLKLYENKLISKVELENGKLLRKMVLDLQENGEWNINCFKTSNNWIKVLQLVDEINNNKS